MPNKKTNIIKFPASPSKLERQVEAILFAASEPLDIETIEKRNKPTWLPPEPFLSLGIKSRLLYERLRARSEI